MIYFLNTNCIIIDIPGSIMAHKMLPSRHGKKLAIIVYVIQTALILPFDLRSRDAVAENKFQ